MGCNSCAYLDSSQKKSGKVDGCLYYCKKNKTFVNAATDACTSYQNGYRDSYEKNEIYRNSKNYYDNDTPIGTFIFILIFLVILGLVLGVFT